MTFTIKSMFLLTAWVAWCSFAILSGRAWVYDATEIIGWIAISSTIALPFTVNSRSRAFWSAYACTVAIFLILAAIGNEAMLRITNSLAYQIVDLYVSLLGNSEGLGNAYLKTTIIEIIVRLHCVPLLGLASALGHKALIGSPTPSPDS